MPGTSARSPSITLLFTQLKLQRHRREGGERETQITTTTLDSRPPRSFHDQLAQGIGHTRSSERGP